MKKYIIVLLAMLSITFSSYSRQEEHAKERIHAAKVAYITDRLHLTSDESSRFWPIYSEFEKERKEIKNSFSQKYRTAHPDASDEEISRLYMDDLDFQQQMVELKIKYKEQYLKIISQEQFAELYPAERDFKDLLKRRLREKERRDNGRWNNHRGNY